MRYRVHHLLVIMTAIALVTAIPEIILLLITIIIGGLLLIILGCLFVFTCELTDYIVWRWRHRKN